MQVRFCIRRTAVRHPSAPWLFAGLLMGQCGVAGAGDYKLLDGATKHVLINSHFSWGLDLGPLGGLGYAYLQGGRFGERNSMPIADDLSLDPNGWLVADKNLRGDINNNQPLVLFLDCNAGYMLKGPDDTAGVNLGVRKLQKLSATLKSMGASEVFFYSTHYTRSRARVGSTLDPAWDSLIINAYNRATNSHLGVNLTTPTYKEWPLEVKSDFEHPLVSWDMYSTELLKAMHAQDGIAVPADVQAAIDNHLNPIRASIQNTRKKMGTTTVTPADPAGLKIGSAVSVGCAGIDPSIKYPVLLLAAWQGGRVVEYALDTTITANGGAFSRSPVIPDSAYAWVYSPISGKLPVWGDSACIMTYQGYGSGDHAYVGVAEIYAISKFYRLLKKDGSSTVGIAARGGAQGLFYANGSLRLRKAEPVFDLSGRLLGPPDRAMAPGIHIQGSR